VPIFGSAIDHFIVSRAITGDRSGPCYNSAEVEPYCTRGLPVKNLEIKVHCDDATFATVRERALALGVVSLLRQRDTYFAVPMGRLKLREVESGVDRRAELIGYSRPDSEAARFSTYHLTEIALDQVGNLTASLAGTVGIRVVVSKVREVVLYRRTRIHIDQVENLGYYIELETVMGDGDSESGAESELAGVMSLIGIEGLPAIGGSYSDLLETAGARTLRSPHVEVFQ
jgi:adenylate cyclase class IV